MRCARHRTCGRGSPCTVCSGWSDATWARLATWKASHPAQVGARPKFHNNKNYKGPPSGSLSDSAALGTGLSPCQDSPGQSEVDLDYDNDALEINASSDEESVGHREWLQSRDQVRVGTGAAPTGADLSLSAGHTSGAIGSASSVAFLASGTGHTSGAIGSAASVAFLASSSVSGPVGSAPGPAQGQRDVPQAMVVDESPQPSSRTARGLAQHPVGSAPGRDEAPRQRDVPQAMVEDASPQPGSRTVRGLTQHPVGSATGSVETRREFPPAVNPVGSVPGRAVGANPLPCPREGSADPTLAHATGPGLFAKPGGSRKRLGPRRTDDPQPKRPLIAATPAAPSQADPNAVSLLRQAAQLMGFSLGPAEPNAGPNAGVNQPQTNVNVSGGDQPRPTVGGVGQPQADVSGVSQPRSTVGGVRQPQAIVSGVGQPQPTVGGVNQPQAYVSRPQPTVGGVSQPLWPQPTVGGVSQPQPTVGGVSQPQAYGSQVGPRTLAVGLEPAVPAALGAPPGEETWADPALPPMDREFDVESSLSGSVLSVDEPDPGAPEIVIGDKAQALLKKYLPQFYGETQDSDQQAVPSASLLFRSRPGATQGIPLTADFQQEYARLTQDAKLRTPVALRRAFKFQQGDYDKFLSPELLSPEILRVADRRPGGNPLRAKAYTEQDKKWSRMADLSRTSMRLAAYAGAVANLLAQADEFNVSGEDRYALNSVLLSLSEEMWSQATRTALYTTRQRREMALRAMGFPARDANQIVRSVPCEGPYLFSGRALQVFDEECAYRKRADETAAKFLQPRRPRPTGSPRVSQASRQTGPRVTVTVPGPASTAGARGSRRGNQSRGRPRQGGRSVYRGAPKGGQGF